MELGLLYDKIQSKIENNTFDLSGITTNMENAECLCSLLGMESIPLQKVSCALQDARLELSGWFDILKKDINIRMQMYVTCDGAVCAEFFTSSIALDSTGIFCAKNCRIRVSLKEGSNDFQEDIEGESELADTTFFLSAHRNSQEEARNLTLQTNAALDALAFLGAILSPAGFDLASFGIDQTKTFQVKTFSFAYTVSDGWFCAAEGEKTDDYFKLEAETDIAFSYQNRLGFSDLGFVIEKYGEEYDVSLSGVLKAFGTAISFCLCGGEDIISISATECEKAMLKSLEELGTVVGESAVASHFPADIHSSGVLSVYAMNLTFSTDFKSIGRFHIAVRIDKPWELCSVPQIKISNVLIGFVWQVSVKQFFIAGDICFCGVKTKLESGLVEMPEGGESSWRFGWHMYEEETISLTGFIGKLAEEFGHDDTKVRLPEIEIAHVAVNYRDGIFLMEADILVTRSRLFSSDTKISIATGNRDGKQKFMAKFLWKSRGDTLTIEEVLKECGVVDGISDVPEFIREIGLSSIELQYDLAGNTLEADVKITGMGEFYFLVTFGAEGFFEFRFLPQMKPISFTELPVAGGLIRGYLLEKNQFGVSDIVVSYRSRPKEKIPAGVRLSFSAMGEEYVCQLYERKEQNVLNATEGTLKTVWMNVDKTVAVFSLHRLGLGFEGARLLLLLDASFTVPPFSFGMLGAGIGVDIKNPSDLRFYLSGFALFFRNEVLSITGEFEKGEKSYSGLLLIQVKQVAVTAVAEYSKDGALMAYAIAADSFGGPPPFFITGIAFGFGYNKRLDLPDIEKVVDYPLIRAARGEIARENMVSDLKTYIATEKGQKFLAAGVRFTSFGMIDSIAILTVNFGNIFELMLLGISDVTMPPHCTKNPIAHAQLALRAVVRPKEGIISVEARLTSESYILSKACRLTGGFAFYYWFAGAHKGDMVLTLGGYKPDYQRPQHYPDVPRVGFNWDMGNGLTTSGEMYFALTPGEVMAGGRLSTVYEKGRLKAYFIAAVDFCMGWKPFHYTASVSVLVGVSYRVDFWFVHHTYTVELGAGLSIWGPDFTGIAHINWFIISFDISFGKDASKEPEKIGWEEFVESFLPEEKDVVKITVDEGIIKSEDKVICRADDLLVHIETQIPMTALIVNEEEEKQLSQAEIDIRPMEHAVICNELKIRIKDQNERVVPVTTELTFQNLPSALWGTKEQEGTLVENVLSGILIRPKSAVLELFPVRNIISLEQLYRNGTIRVKNAFAYMTVEDIPIYSEDKSIEIFSSTVDDTAVEKNREALLCSMGISLTKEISMTKYAENAENLLSENLWVVA